MKGLRRTATVIAIGLIAGALLAGPATLAEAKAGKPTTVGTDPAGDWGANVDPTLAPLADPLGEDLTGAAISFDGKNINFVIQLNSLPPTGGVPEISRYTWDFMVNGKFAELDGKFTNYSRGVCDPTANSCPPPRDPGMAPFFIRGNCTVTSAGTNLTTCEELGIVQATFDAATATITVPVPADLIGAKKGSKITGGTNIFGGNVSTSPATFFSFSNYPLDTLVVTKTFVVK